MIKSNRTKLRRIKAKLDNIDYNPQESQINDILQNAAYDTSSIFFDVKSPILAIDTESNNTFQHRRK